MLGRPPSWWLQCVGVAHGSVGAVIYRRALGDIARNKVVGSVPDWGDRATAFWFLASAPSFWLCGRLLRSAECAGDLRAQRVAGGVLVALGAVGSAAMPNSGFWVVAAAGFAALRRGSRPW